MEGDPFTLIEGMVIAGIATGATKGYVYIRSEYPDAIRVMEAAVKLANGAKLLGPSRPRLSPRLRPRNPRRRGGLCLRRGNQSLLNSLEGKRGVVRAKPPLPALQGFMGRPPSSTTSSRSRPSP